MDKWETLASCQRWNKLLRITNCAPCGARGRSHSCLGKGQKGLKEWIERKSRRENYRLTNTMITNDWSNENPDMSALSIQSPPGAAPAAPTGSQSMETGQGDANNGDTAFQFMGKVVMGGNNVVTPAESAHIQMDTDTEVSRRVQA